MNASQRKTNKLNDQQMGKSCEDEPCKRKRYLYRIFQGSVPRDSIKSQGESGRKLLSVTKAGRRENLGPNSLSIFPDKCR